MDLERLRQWRRGLRIFFYRADTDAWIFAFIVCGLLAGLGFVLSAVYADREALRLQRLEAQKRSIACLARNVYFEARGEPLAGQYAVAEVTMNRAASAFFPRSVCDVVHEKGAFSWTSLGPLPEPVGEEWQRALEVAETVYYGRRPPALHGALFYHATQVHPEWAKERQRVTRIGRHIFYR
ncbi:MAG TPA: cell wall hydrolase [Burkholderiales bacterium]|nr:cell wall hydrolase [Burkholderiales bacterium]